MAARRTQLVRAALDVAVRHGIKATTVRAVAAEAGVSLGVVHYCFEDKNELLREVGTAITDENVDQVEFTLPPGPDARAAVGAALGSLWDAIRAHAGAQLLGFELTTSSLRQPELRTVATAQLEHRLLAAEQILTQAAVLAGVEWTVPLRQVARLFVAAMNGVALAWLVDGDDDAARGVVLAVADQIATHTAPVGSPGDAR